jgi:hypothetical protein
VPRARAGGPPGSHLRLTIAGTSGISHALPSTASTVPAALVAATSHRGYAAGAQPPHQVGVSSGDRLHVCPVDVWETQQTGSAQQHATQRLASSLTPGVHQTCWRPDPVRPHALAARRDRRSTHDREYPAGGDPSEHVPPAPTMDRIDTWPWAGPLRAGDECTNGPWVLLCAPVRGRRGTTVTGVDSEPAHLQFRGEVEPARRGDRPSTVTHKSGVRCRPSGGGGGSHDK